MTEASSKNRNATTPTTIRMVTTTPINAKYSTRGCAGFSAQDYYQEVVFSATDTDVLGIGRSWTRTDYPSNVTSSRICIPFNASHCFQSIAGVRCNPASDLLQCRFVFSAALFGVVPKVLTGFFSYQVQSLAAQKYRLVAFENIK